MEKTNNWMIQLFFVNQQGKKTTKRLTALLLVLTASVTLQKYKPAAETKGGFSKHKFRNLHMNEAESPTTVMELIS